MIDTSKPGRKRTGTVEEWIDAAGVKHRRARIRLADGTRTRAPIPDGYSEARARDWAAALQEQEDTHGKLLAAKRTRAMAGGALSPAEGDAWLQKWIDSRIARGLTSWPDNRAHFRHHIRPALAGKHVRDWTADDLRTLVAALDAKIAGGILSPKSAENVFGTATRMVADASRSKLPGLRVRTDNPALGVEGPDGGADREKQYLYPSELLRALSCEAIPLRWRRAIALAIYMFPRAGELRALRWESVDLEHGTVHLHEAFERRSRTIKATKSMRGRRFTIEPTILPLLKAMHAETSGKGLVCPLPNRMSDRLRGWLARAGVKRTELLDTTSKTLKPLAWHDLRATGLTWCAVRGDEPLKIMQRAGHADFATTQIYIRTAEAVRDGFGVVFPPLPPCLLVSNWATELGHRAARGPKSSRIVPFSERETGFEPATSPEPAAISGAARTDASASSPVSPQVHVDGKPVAQSNGPKADEALKAAITAAVQSGDVSRAKSLLDVLAGSPKLAPVVSIVGRKR